jgi:hypothetical protein
MTKKTLWSTNSHGDSRIGSMLLSKGNDRMEISADHSKMVKFQSKSDEHYQRVVVKIKEIMENHEKKL